MELLIVLQEKDLIEGEIYVIPFEYSGQVVRGVVFQYMGNLGRGPSVDALGRYHKDGTYGVGTIVEATVIEKEQFLEAKKYGRIGALPKLESYKIY